MELSPTRAKALEIAQSYTRRANTHPSAMEWRKEAIESFGFYDGSDQWSAKDRAVVEGRDQVPLTVNLIQGRLDSLSGVEIQSRYRTAVQNNSGDKEKDELARAITQWLYYIQTDQRIPHKGSLKFRDMLACGLGWSGIYQEDGVFYYDYVHPFNIIPDFDDLSPQFDSMKFVCRKRWMEPDIVKKLWPKIYSYINFSDVNLGSTVYSPELMDRQSNFTGDNNYAGYAQSRVLVNEVQHKVPKISYCGIDTNGFYFETFDEEKAEQMAPSSRDIEEKKSTQIIRTLFLDNFLLETAPLNPNIPGLKDFSYIPCVWKRRFKTGVPYGLLDCMKDIQRDSNVRLTKALYLSNSSRLIIEGNIPAGQSTIALQENLKRPDSVIILPPGTKWESKDNSPLSDAQITMLHEHDRLMQRATGIYDDMMGVETNASSGVAQRQRQINSVRNNVFAFDNFADMKERESKFMLSLFQGGENENILSQILTEKEKQIIILNLTRTINGKKVVFNDVRTLPVSLEIEEVPDYKNSREENREALQNLLSNPSAPLIMRSASLMGTFGVRDSEKIAQEIQQASAEDQGMKAPTGSSNDAPINENEQSLAYPGM